jgi:hypothetical protein
MRKAIHAGESSNRHSTAMTGPALAMRSRHVAPQPRSIPGGRGGRHGDGGGHRVARLLVAACDGTPRLDRDDAPGRGCGSRQARQTAGPRQTNGVGRGAAGAHPAGDIVAPAGGAHSAGVAGGRHARPFQLPIQGVRAGGHDAQVRLLHRGWRGDPHQIRERPGGSCRSGRHASAQRPRIRRRPRHARAGAALLRLPARTVLDDESGGRDPLGRSLQANHRLREVPGLPMGGAGAEVRGTAHRNRQARGLVVLRARAHQSGAGRGAPRARRRHAVDGGPARTLGQQVREPAARLPDPRLAGGHAVSRAIPADAGRGRHLRAHEARSARLGKDAGLGEPRGLHRLDDRITLRRRDVRAVDDRRGGPPLPGAPPLSDAQLRALFTHARFAEPRGIFTPQHHVDDWVRVFRGKIREITDGPRCPATT